MRNANATLIPHTEAEMEQEMEEFFNTGRYLILGNWFKHNKEQDNGDLSNPIPKSRKRYVKLCGNRQTS